jgi:hypothetical protein
LVTLVAIKPAGAAGKLSTVIVVDDAEVPDVLIDFTTTTLLLPGRRPLTTIVVLVVTALKLPETTLYLLAPVAADQLTVKLV